MDETIAICAAVDEELAPLRSLQGRLRLAAIGVGPVEAALGALRALGEMRPAAAVLVGTCGAFPGKGLRIGQAVVVERSLLTSSDAAAGLSYVPAPAAIVSRGDPRLVRALARAAELKAVGCVTVPAITRDEAHARGLAEATGAETEHLEAHAFLRAAELLGIPAACVLGVSNEVGPSAHVEWKAHADEASEAAARAVAAWLDFPS